MANDVTINIKTVVDQSKSALNSLKGSWTELNSALGVAQQAYQSLQSAYNATVGDYVAQAQAVRELALATGTGADETSRMIQVFDDAGINTDKLRATMIAMKNNGISPTIEEIARMADEYRAIQDPVARVTYLTENLGTRGIEVGKVFDQTGEQIRAAGKAVDESLIFDEKKIQAAEELRMAQDELNDSLQAIKNEIVGGLVPGLAKVTSSFADYTTAVRESQKEHGSFETTIKTYQVILSMVGDALEKVSYQTAMATAMQKQANSVLGQGTVEYGNYQRATSQANDAAQDLQSTVDISQTAHEQYMIAIQGVEDGLRRGEEAARADADANQALFDTLNTGLSNTIANTLEKIEWLKLGGAELQKQYELAFEALVKDPGNPEAQKRIDDLYIQAEALDVRLGKITAEQAAQNIADNLGAPIQYASEQLQSVLDKMAALNGTRSTVYIDVVTNGSVTMGGGGGGSVGTPIPGAGTGPGAGGPGGSGRAPDNPGAGTQSVGSYGSQSTTVGAINIYQREGENAQALAKRVKNELNRSSRNAYNSRSGGYGRG